MRSIYSKSIITPHIPLGVSLEAGLKILKSVSQEIEKDTDEDQTFYKIQGENYEMGFYEDEGKVTSTWYNDWAGRFTPFGKKKKISLYLQRYGIKKNWEKGINNGWIQFFYNETDNVGMAYGLDKDVIRFNLHEQGA